MARRAIGNDDVDRRRREISWYVSHTSISLVDGHKFSDEVRQLMPWLVIPRVGRLWGESSFEYRIAAAGSDRSRFARPNLTPAIADNP
jgi:hypothetical protein